ncbi:MAG: asparagine synthase-related protein [Gemmataceae bacterium]
MFVGTIHWSRATAARAWLREHLESIGDGIELLDSASLGLATFVHRALPGHVARMRRHSTLPLVAVFDGLLHNRKELASQLSPTVEAEDVDLLLAAYAAWGTRLVEKLVGDFTLAVWDEAERSLFAAVDPFGLRGLFFGGQGENLSIASHPGPLLRLPGIADRINESMLVRCLADRWGSVGATFHADIQRLPAGHSLVAAAHGRRIERYWRPGETRCASASGAAVLEEFASLCRQAVRERMPASLSAGMVMSGGIDSTALAGIVAELRRATTASGPFTVFAGVFGDLPGDESRYIDDVLQRTGLSACRLPDLGRGICVDGMRREVRRNAGPVVNSQSPLFDAFVEAARARGADVLLNGLGGDELATDYEHLADLRRHRCWRRLASASRSILETSPDWQTCVWLARELCPEWLKVPYRQLKRLRPRRAAMLPRWLTPQAMELCQIDDEETRGPTVQLDCPSLERSWQILNLPFTQFAFWHWGNEFASGGLRATSPYLDRRLFEFVYSVPYAWRPPCTADAPFKPWLTRGLRDYLPASLQRRRDKASLSAYANLVFQLGFAELREYLFAGGPWELQPFVPRAEAMALFDGFRFDAAENLRDPESIGVRVQPLRQIAAAELWLREGSP